MDSHCPLCLKLPDDVLKIEIDHRVCMKRGMNVKEAREVYKECNRLFILLSAYKGMMVRIYSFKKPIYHYFQVCFNKKYVFNNTDSIRAFPEKRATSVLCRLVPFSFLRVFIIFLIVEVT